MTRWQEIRHWVGLWCCFAAIGWSLLPKTPAKLQVKQGTSGATSNLYLTWDDLSDPAPFTVEYEIWHSSVLTSNQFTLLAVVPFIGAMVTNNGVLEYFICRSRYTYDTNLVSDWNKP